jgi:hypothetical protein|tara:strand:+ start:2272 stop:2712 length:441 start_codon:yes stop_codon:yes gene_type:complete
LKLSELQEEWQKDAPINETNLGQEAARVPMLHAKYITILSKIKLQLRKAESDYLNNRRLKYKYYRGELTREELEDSGWTQFQGNKPLKNEMDELLQCDKDLIELQDKHEYYKTVIYTLEQIIRSINSRTWDVKSSIEWTKFTNGMM